MIRHNLTTNAWEDIIGTNYLLNIIPRHSRGVGLVDNSCSVVKKEENVGNRNLYFIAKKI